MADDVQELKGALTELRKDVKDIRQEVNNKFQEIYISRTAMMTKDEAEDKYYPKSELDRMFKAIEGYAGGVKELLDKQNTVFQKQIDELKKEIDDGKSKVLDKIFTFSVSLVTFILGAGLMFIVKLISGGK